MMLKIYYAYMNLQGVLLFSTYQKASATSTGGAVIYTGHYIHNYPLIYGILNKSAESYAVISSLHYNYYTGLQKLLKTNTGNLQYTTVYQEIDRIMKGMGGIYVYPAKPEYIMTKKYFMTSQFDSYAVVRGCLKTVYPRLERYVAIVPPSKFSTIILSIDREMPRTMYFRIGIKRMGVFKTELYEAKILGKIDRSEWTTHPVNIYDTRMFGYDIEDVVKVLETRSKVKGKETASIIGYVKSKDLYKVGIKIGCRLTILYIPLPKHLV